jgi:hypothetical protein
MEFLNDETGSVRWVCFLLQGINWDYKKDVDINMVWGQAYHLFKSKDYDYQLSREEIKENEIANKTFLIRSPEMELIQKYLVSSTQSEFKEQGTHGPISFMTSTDILTLIQYKSQGAIKLSSTNVGKSLALLCFAAGSMYLKDLKISVKGYYVIERDNNDTYEFSEVSRLEPDSLNPINKVEAYQANLPY